MKIAMSGATGFIGGHLAKAFEKKGWTMIPLGRKDFERDTTLPGKIDGADVVVNLAGANVAARWTEAYKKIIYDSRIETTKKIVAALGGAREKPRLFFSTSAVGIYDTKDSHTEEDRHYADDFLGRVAQDWEREALKAADAGVRTVIFRFGIVLGPDGGALGKMLIPFKLGLGGVIGSGEQPFSWVHIDDLVRAFFAVIENSTYEGIYNLTAPRPTTNRGLTKALGRALLRPTFMRIPPFVLRLQFGEGADILLKGQSVLPKRLQESGFTFAFTEIQEAIDDLVKKK
ncbi:MAG: TIGR01777 family oxidoreductase [Nitrospirae bacterium]|nr:TIGR01777 family oxidoreductase [Nitrospirota bacterium]